MAQRVRSCSDSLSTVASPAGKYRRMRHKYDCFDMSEWGSESSPVRLHRQPLQLRDEATPMMHDAIPWRSGQEQTPLGMNSIFCCVILPNAVCIDRRGPASPGAQKAGGWDGERATPAARPLPGVSICRPTGQMQVGKVVGSGCILQLPLVPLPVLQVSSLDTPQAGCISSQECHWRGCPAPAPWHAANSLHDACIALALANCGHTGADANCLACSSSRACRPVHVQRAWA